MRKEYRTIQALRGLAALQVVVFHTLEAGTQRLRPGHAVAGPAVLIDDISTVVVEPRCTAHVTGGRDLRIEVGGDAGAPARAQTECDPIQLAVFSHRCGWCTACRHPCPHWRT